MPELRRIADLHPTQMTLGLRAAERRAELIGALGDKKRAEYIQARPVPCVSGPKGRLYPIDRHHMCRSLLSLGIQEVRIEVQCDTRQLSLDEFWVFMDLRGWVHPFDAAGKRRPISEMPSKIADLADDPYRALAGFLRRDEGFMKKDTPFEEFIWADYLRRRVDMALLTTDYDKAKTEALKLARSDEAQHLPGWKEVR